MKQVVFIVEKTATGYSAFAKDYSAYTTGDNLKELKENMLEAINLYFEEIGKKHITEDQIHAQLDLSQFFEFYKEINSKALSKRIGMNESLLSQYITGVKKPSEKQIEKILLGVRNLGKELSEIEFA